VRAARATAEAEAASQLGAMREVVRLRSAKHTLRLREVLASEETCHAHVQHLRKRLAEASLTLLALHARATCAERHARTRHVSVASLHAELCELEDEIDVRSRAHAATHAAGAAAAAAAETEVHELRGHVRALASRQKGWRRALEARHDADVNARVRELVDATVDAEVARVQDEMHEEMEARAEQQREALGALAAERDALADALGASRRREELLQADAEALNRLLD
jgi:predicted  nucleic acid-binding Zn-ribbon protein